MTCRKPPRLSNPPVRFAFFVFDRRSCAHSCLATNVRSQTRDRPTCRPLRSHRWEACCRLSRAFLRNSRVLGIPCKVRIVCQKTERSAFSARLINFYFVGPYGAPPQGVSGFVPGGMPPYGQAPPMVPPYQAAPPRPAVGMRPPVMSPGGRY